MRGEGVHISMTDCYRETDYGEPMVGLKSFILSPFIDERDVERLVRDILDARQALGARGETPRRTETGEAPG